MKNPHTNRHVITCLFLCSLILLIHGKAAGQVPKKKISLTVNKAIITEVLSEVNKKIKPKYSVTYAYSKVDSTVKLTKEYNNVSLKNVLDDISAIWGLNWQLQGNIIILTMAEKPKVLPPEVSKAKNAVKPETAAAREETTKMDIVHFLNEVVSVGYGKTTRRNNTGNVDVIQGASIWKQPVNDVTAAMAGRVPGMLVSQSSGVPGTPVEVIVGGRNSLMSGMDPLYVMDGVPILPVMYGGLKSLIWSDNASATGIINPYDVERMDISKDADATAIYGAKGANGAILITTRKGKAGPPEVIVNVSRGWEAVGHNMKLLNTSEYLDMRREAFTNDQVTANRNNAKDLKVWDTTVDQQWQKKLIGHVAPMYAAHASVTEGTDNFNILLGAGYQWNRLVYMGDFSNRKGGLHCSLAGTSTNKRFKATFTGSVYSEQACMPGTDLTAYIQAPPNAPLYDSTGMEPDFSYNNPLQSLRSNIFEASVNNTLGALNVSYILKNLKFSTNAGYYLLDGTSVSTKPISALPADQRADGEGTSQFATYAAKSLIIEPQVDWAGKALKGNMEALAGFTIQGRSETRHVMYASGYKNDDYLKIADSATSVIDTLSISNYKYGSLFARLSYMYGSRYKLQISVRQDQSSRFGQDKRNAFFIAGGASWIFTEEPGLAFLKKAFSFGKLRFSVGTTGNDQIGDYMYMTRYKPMNGAYQNVQGWQPVSVTNNLLSWERTTKREIGLEAADVRQRMFISASYYLNHSTRLLMYEDIPEITGTNSMLTNTKAKIRNRGLELLMNIQWIKRKQFSWNSMFNLTLPENKIVSYPVAGSGRVNQSVTEVNVYKSRGVNRDDGSYRFDNGMGDAVAASGGIKLIVSENLAPKWFGGLENTICYKRFELMTMATFVKRKIMTEEVTSGYMPGYQMNQPAAVKDRWRKAGDESRFQRYTQKGTLRDGYSALQNSDFVYGDGFYLKLKTVSLTYNVDIKKLNIKHVKEFSLFLQGQNLFTITPYTGLDPESTIRRALPPLRSIRTGLRLVF